ncbi:MAG: hypothetical protein ACX93U_00070 [Salipiger thiooxidans]|uniref:hypothetical protein n=1 Tax=Salipiger thiooxidans TaxID=282683 RepID=UPI001CF9D447|nr:hypothetical protein [Salipiger thiooxidans]
MTTEETVAAIRSAFDRELLGIEQVDAVLCEDGGTLLLYGHTSDPSVTYTASFPLPAVEWRRADG